MNSILTASRSSEFLNDFVRVETYLRKLADGRREDSFSLLVTRAAAKSAAVRRFSEDLREYAELRNAIVHERRGGQAIAEPHTETVDDLRRIADIILDPPRVTTLGSMDVVTCSPDSSIGASARAMLTGGFSQLPVYDGREFVGLLTSETIARWMGSELERHGGMIEEQPVSVVLPFRETCSVEAFVGRGHYLIDVVELFESKTRDGLTLDAVIVTHDGHSNQKPLHILTVFDLPRLYASSIHGREQPG